MGGGYSEYQAWAVLSQRTYTAVEFSVHYILVLQERDSFHVTSFDAPYIRTDGYRREIAALHGKVCLIAGRASCLHGIRA